MSCDDILYNTKTSRGDEMVEIITPMDTMPKIEQHVYQYNKIINNMDIFIIVFTFLEYEVNYKGNMAYKKELDDFSKYLADGLYHYGVYTLLSEIRHIYRSFSVYHDHLWATIMESGKQYTMDVVYGEIRSSAYRLGLEKYIDNAEEIVNYIVDYPDKDDLLSVENSLIGQMDLFELFPEKYTKIEYIRGMQILFNLNNDELFVFWDSMYGGKAWEDIAKIIGNRGNISDIIFVDNCLDLEHNTGSWFNKIESYLGENDVREILDYRLKGDFKSLQTYYHDSLRCIDIEFDSELMLYRMVI